jgi:DNA polymerase
MGIVAIDFESYYASDYTLNRMSTIDYILDPRFQLIMAAVKEDHQPSETFVGIEAVRERLSRIDWDNSAMLSHNCVFDAGIMSWRLGIEPALYLDTFSMARALTHHKLGSSSLAKVAEHLGLPPKGQEVHSAKGWGLADFQANPEALMAYRSYCRHDNELCRMIFDRFMTVFPTSELPVIDMTVRMFCAPQVMLDPHVLAEHLAEVRARKAQMLARVGHLDPCVFSSNPQFAALLERHGVEVPRKVSPATGEETWALAKNDRAFKELCSDPEQPEEVQTLLAVRVGSKSTQEETRTEKMLALSLKHWPDNLGQGWAPVPLRYFGAHTGRFSGSDGFNWQNFKRGSRIREAIKAPEGYRIVHRDSSQIEARVNAWLADCESLLEAFRQGRDIYSEFASEAYARTITRADKLARHVGKTVILGSGYGMGAERMRHTLFIGQGGISVEVSDEEAAALVSLYRARYPEIPQLWNKCDQLARSLMVGSSVSTPYIKDCIKTAPEAIWLPNGLPLNYRNLRKQVITNTRSEMVYDDPYDTPRKLFGGKITENLCQALARIVITEIMTRVKASSDSVPFLTTHDSLDYCVPEDEAEAMDALLEAEFARAPVWAPGLPLASEGGWGSSLKLAEDKVNQ